MSPDERTVVDKFKIAQAVADQIAVEQNLRSNRMSWNLTFQGFMMAAFALVVAEDLNPARIALEIIICLAGLSVTLATWHGVKAAELKSDDLKFHWNIHNLNQSRFPTPFSVGDGSKLGRRPPRIICLTTSLMWIALLVITIIFWPQPFTDGQQGHEKCIGICHNAP